VNAIGVVTFLVVVAMTTVTFLSYSKISSAQTLKVQYKKQQNIGAKLKSPQRQAKYRIARTC
jgi:hypothetical protein